MDFPPKINSMVKSWFSGGYTEGRLTGSLPSKFREGFYKIIRYCSEDMLNRRRREEEGEEKKEKNDENDDEEKRDEVEEN